MAAFGRDYSALTPTLSRALPIPPAGRGRPRPPLPSPSPAGEGLEFVCLCFLPPLPAGGMGRARERRAGEVRARVGGGYKLFKYSIKAHFCSSGRVVPYVCPAFELPGSVASNSNPPGYGAVSKPTLTGSSSR